MNTNINKIGSVVSLLRKEKGVTQEELGNAVGVSAQAVSKWECGGIPDTELLPAIADYFGVSLDTLFGREPVNENNICGAIIKYLAGTPREDRMMKAYELCWAMQHGIAGESMELYKKNELSDVFSSYYYSVDQPCFSLIHTDNGYAQMRLSEEHPYFLLMPKTDAGYDYLADGTYDFPKLFRAFGDCNILKALIFLYSRSEPKPFTLKLLEKNLGFDEETSGTVLSVLKEYGFVKHEEIELDDDIQAVYRLREPNPAFVSMLTFACEIICRPHVFNMYYGNGNCALFG
jgi:transcriptional regulator with XRE-family HTH domain